MNVSSTLQPQQSENRVRSSIWGSSGQFIGFTEFKHYFLSSFSISNFTKWNVICWANLIFHVKIKSKKLHNVLDSKYQLSLYISSRMSPASNRILNKYSVSKCPLVSYVFQLKNSYNLFRGALSKR